MEHLAQDASFKNRRRQAISKNETQIGIDYIEFDSAQKQLKLYFIPAAPTQRNKPVCPEITEANIRLLSENGLEQQFIRVGKVENSKKPTDPKIPLIITLEYSQGQNDSGLPIYLLQLVNVSHLDPFFAQVHFSLQNKSQFDPQVETTKEDSGAPKRLTPEIDYLSKDYSSFRELMLNRLSLLMPAWQENQPADLELMLVELLAFAADRASYYQDAVGTEAYLSTARRRISVRRHARLINYMMHEGCNARAWVQIQVEKNGGSNEITVPVKSPLLTKVTGLSQCVLDESSYQEALSEGAVVFETMEKITLDQEQNEINFYTWGARHFVLAKGSTHATLRGELESLNKGQILIFKEVRSPVTGKKADADLTRRHAVRLTEVRRGKDPLGKELYGKEMPIAEIRWHDEDALPFPFTISNISSNIKECITVACGNIVLADHGRTITDKQNQELIPSTVPASGPYRPSLRRTNLTYSVSYDEVMAEKQSATSQLSQAPREAIPTITLCKETSEISLLLYTNERSHGSWWLPKLDLLNSNRFSQAFVVEMENDRRAFLRFGNGIQGKQPSVGEKFQATYRVGNGTSGNVGQDTIAHLYLRKENKTKMKIISVCNLLAATGGIDPEMISDVQLYAPTSFQTQERCITEADYVEIITRHPEVQEAATIFRWTGSWYTAIIAIRRVNDFPIDYAFRQRMLEFMAPYRVAGNDINIRAPRFVALDIALTVRVADAYFASMVKQRLLEIFSAADLPNREPGFFNSDRFSFGQSVYLSQIITKAAAITGVLWVKAARFRRWGQNQTNMIEQTGKILIGPLEIVQVQNKADSPELGQITFDMKGGR